MKFQLLFIFLTLVIQTHLIHGMKKRCYPIEVTTSGPPACGAHQEWLECGPTPECSQKICRGARPVCRDDDPCVAGCFCKDPYKMDNGQCILNCPLYPSAPPRG